MTLCSGLSYSSRVKFRVSVARAVEKYNEYKNNLYMCVTDETHQERLHNDVVKEQHVYQIYILSLFINGTFLLGNVLKDGLLYLYIISIKQRNV